MTAVIELKIVKYRSLPASNRRYSSSLRVRPVRGNPHPDAKQRDCNQQRPQAKLEAAAI
jgi:hypothetical protein